MGGATTDEALAGLPEGWTVLQGVQQPDRHRRVIDHLVVGPGGVFVVVEQSADAGPAAATGRTTRTARRRRPRRRERTVRATSAAADAVAEVVPDVARKLVRPVLCVDGVPALSGVREGVVVCSPDNIVELLTTRTALLSDRSAHETVRALVRALQPVGSPRRMRPRPTSRVGRWLHALRDVGVLVGAVLVVAALVTHAADLRDYVAGVLSQDAGTLGEPVAVSAAAVPVTVIAREARDVHARRPAAVPKGQRLVGVLLEVRNRGAAQLRFVPATSISLRPALGTAPSSEVVRTPIRAGRLLPREVLLPGGGRARGWVVLAVPAGASFDQVAVDIGEDADVARWDAQLDPPQ